MAVAKRHLLSRHMFVLLLISVGAMVYCGLFTLTPVSTREKQHIENSERGPYQPILIQAKNQFTKGEVIWQTLSNLYKMRSAQCSKLFEGKPDAIKNSLKFTRRMRSWSQKTIAFYLKATMNCPDFIRRRGYITSSLTSEEENFPIAYSLVVYKNVEMVERLLRAIYRPQNTYCIHVDMKAKPSFYGAVKSIAKCFKNVILPSRRVVVSWGAFSVLEADLICMEELWKYKRWRYFINLTGQEFPLRTNLELVRIFTAYAGANDVRSTNRTDYAKRWRDTAIPEGITPMKGSVHIAVNRDFVDYVLHNDTAHQIEAWVKRCKIPDELFFSTLNHNPHLGIRGSYKGVPETNDMVKPYLTRFKKWERARCQSDRRVRQICILGTADLPELSKAKHYFANKFYLDEDRLAIGCLEERLFNNTRDEFLGRMIFDSTYYEELGFVKNKVD